MLDKESGYDAICGIAPTCICVVVDYPAMRAARTVSLGATT